MQRYRASLVSGLADFQKDIRKRKDTQGMLGTNERRRYLEHHHSIETHVTDKDMLLLLQIDHALDIGEIRSEDMRSLQTELIEKGFS